MELNLNVIAPINNVSYGLVSTNLISVLNAAGIKVALLPIGPAFAEPKHSKAIQVSIDRLSLFDYKAPCLKIWHQHFMADSIGVGPRYGFPIFELREFTDVEKHQLNSLDCIIVCSSWAKRIIHHQLPNFPNHNVNIVNLGVDREIFHGGVINDQYDKSVTTFLNIGKWEIRKGHDILLEAFNKAFGPNDNVRLIMHCHDAILGEKRNNEWESYYKNSPLGNKIFFTNGRCNNQAEIAKLIALADFGVFPSRAEGWNLPLCEMLAMGRRCIATKNSAHEEYCSEDNCELISDEGIELAFDEPWFRGQGNWAKLGGFSLHQLISSLRKLYKETKHGYNDKVANSVKHLTWENSAAQLKRAIYG